MRCLAYEDRQSVRKKFELAENRNFIPLKKDINTKKVAVLWTG